MVDSKGAFIDKLELYRIDVDGNWNKDIETNVNLSLTEKISKFLGIYKCIDDALTDYAIADFATYISAKYGYASTGTDGTDGDVYTFNDLKSPVMTRTKCTKSIDTTYSTNDTAVFTAIVTASGGYTLTEFGLHDAETDGNMGARQVSCTWSVTNGEVFGMIWRVIASRG